jgi:hypothetical protein
MNLNDNLSISEINNQINIKVQKAFSGISTKNLKNNIKELNNDIKKEYNQLGGLVNFYIENKFKQIVNKIAGDVPKNGVVDDVPSSNESDYVFQQSISELLVLFILTIDAVKYNKVTGKTYISWLNDDLEELIEENYKQFETYVNFIYKFINQPSIIEEIKKLFESDYDDAGPGNKQFKIDYNIFKKHIEFIFIYNKSPENKKSELKRKKDYDKLLIPDKKAFESIATYRTNKFYKYTTGLSGETITNEEKDSGLKFNTATTQDHTILEDRVFTKDENDNFIQIIKDIIDFAKEKLSNGDREDKDKIIIILNKIRDIDIKMNTTFTENVKMIKKLFVNKQDNSDDTNIANKKERNKFISNIVKLQNSLFQFQIRIIFTQITHINNIVNRRLLLDKADKTEFMDKINDLLDIVNKKVEIMNEYLSATTDENKNLIPLTQQYKYNQYEYIIDPDTNEKIVIKKKKEHKDDDDISEYDYSANELEDPLKSVLKKIKNDNSNKTHVWEDKFPSKYEKIMIDDEKDDINDQTNQPASSSTIAQPVNVEDTIQKLNLNISNPNAMPISETNQSGGGVETVKNYLQSVLDSKVKDKFIVIDDTINLAQYIITNFYLINKICLYVFNNNIIKKLMLLFLTPSDLFKLLTAFNIDIVDFINCFFIRIISVNPTIDIFTIKNIENYLKHNDNFKQINYLYQFIKSENVYSNTLIYYNLMIEYYDHISISPIIVPKITQQEFNKIIESKYVFYFIPYLLINIKNTIYKSHNYNIYIYLKYILVKYLHEILNKLYILFNIILEIKKVTDYSDKLNLKLINGEKYKLPLLVNLVTNESTTKKVVDYLRYPASYSGPIQFEQLVKGNDNIYDDKYKKPIHGSDLVLYDLSIFGKNISRMDLKNMKIIKTLIKNKTNDNFINSITIKYINYNKRFNTYQRQGPPYKNSTSNYDGGFETYEDSKIDDKTQELIDNSIIKSLDINSYKFGIFHNIYKLNNDDSHSDASIIDGSGILLKNSAGNYDNTQDIIDLINIHNISKIAILIGLGISGSGKTTYLIGNISNPGPGLLIRYISYMVRNEYTVEIIGIEIRSQYNGIMSQYDIKKDTITNQIKKIIINNDILTNQDKINEINDLLSKNRHVAPTPNNKESSRSQMILKINFTHSSDSNLNKIIILCDLAGNETIFKNDELYFIVNTYMKMYELSKNSNNKKIQIKIENFYTLAIQSENNKNFLRTNILLYINNIYRYLHQLVNLNPVPSQNNTFSTSKKIQDIKQMDNTDRTDDEKLSAIITLINTQFNLIYDLIFKDHFLNDYGSYIHPAINNLINIIFINYKKIIFEDYIKYIEIEIYLKLIKLYNELEASNFILDETFIQKIINSDLSDISDISIILNEINLLNYFKNTDRTIYKDILIFLCFVFFLKIKERDYFENNNNHQFIYDISKLLGYDLPNATYTNIFYLYCIYNDHLNDPRSQKTTTRIVSFDWTLINGLRMDTFDLKNFLIFCINIFAYILITINTISFNLLLRKYEGEFINTFINNVKNDCSKLLKYYNIYNYKKIKKNLNCTLSHITKSQFLEINDNNNKICLLPTTNIYIDECNDNNDIYTDIKINMINNDISYESDIFKYFYFDGGEYKIAKESKGAKRSQELKEEEIINKSFDKLQILMKNIFNESCKIIFVTVVNFYDWPQFNENSIPYININELKKIYNIIISLFNNELILEYSNVALFEQFKKKIITTATNLQELIEKYVCYNGSYVIKLISDLLIIMNQQIETGDYEQIFILSVINSIKPIVFKIITTINSMNNLSFISSIDTKNLLENNDLNTVCTIKKDTNDIEQTSFDSLDTFKTDNNINEQELIDTMFKGIIQLSGDKQIIKNDDTFMKDLLKSYTAPNELTEEEIKKNTELLVTIKNFDDYKPYYSNKYELQFPD